MLETRVLQDTPRSLVTTEGAVDFQINDAQPAPQKGEGKVVMLEYLLRNFCILLYTFKSTDLQAICSGVLQS